MANIGLNKLYIAKYNYDSASDTVSYSDGMRWEQVMNLSIDAGSTDTQKLYADNRLVESYRSVNECGVDLGVGQMPFDVYKLMFGKEISKVTLKGSESKTVDVLSDGGDGDTPYLGLGVVVSRVVNSKNQFMAVVLKKAQFDWPSDSFETMEESVTWQTPSLSGTLMREDSKTHAMREYAICDSEEDAEKYIKQVLNITDLEA